MVTEIGLGIQPGIYTLNITSGLLYSNNSSNLSGYFDISGTWNGGEGNGTFRLLGNWTADPGWSNFVLDSVSITDDPNKESAYTSTWETLGTTIQGSPVNLINDGRFGQINSQISPIRFEITQRYTPHRWKIYVVQNSMYTYRAGNPNIRYACNSSESTFSSTNTYIVSSASGGSFFDSPTNAYYSTSSNTSVVVVGENIPLIFIGRKIESVADTDESIKSALDAQEELLEQLPPSGSPSLTSPTISETGYVEQIPVSEDTLSPSSGSVYAVPAQHYSKSMLPSNIEVEKDQSLSDNLTNVYKIKNVPPGLFSGENYVIVPSDNPDKAWRYFYHLTADSNSVEQANDGTMVINNVRAEFPSSEDPTNYDHWVELEPDSTDFGITFPATGFSVYRNKFQPRESKMFAWAGEQHFGIIVGEPGDANVKRYLIY